MVMAERKVSKMVLLTMRMFLKPPTDAVPNLMPLALEQALLLRTVMFWQRLLASCDLRQMASSVAST